MLKKLLQSGGGIPSICSAHPEVLREALRVGKAGPVLIESTCNQVNQYGGYTGMKPDDFVTYVRGIAEKNDFPVGNLLLGGDHLGPVVWQNEPADSAMKKSIEMVQAYVRAGYKKIHLDCSVRLGDDPAGILDTKVIAERAAQLAEAAEMTASEVGQNDIEYVIGTEVPIPGGATAHEEGVHVTEVTDLQNTIHVHQQAFYKHGLQNAWNRAIAVVVQPGVEFGDDFVLAYHPNAAVELSKFIENKGIVFEAHSTDYQSRESLTHMVKDHFAILKVGPGLTFAYREAIFALAFMENELFDADERSNVIDVIDDVMVRQPIYWKKYYPGTENEQAFKRKYSLSDRCRYYWVQPEIQNAVNKLFKNLGSKGIPLSLASQFAAGDLKALQLNGKLLTAENIVSCHITNVLADYWSACNLPG